MQTPNTEAGRTTENIMAKVKERLPNISTNDYNRTYEAVLEVLEIRFAKRGDVIRRPGGGGIMF